MASLTFKIDWPDAEITQELEKAIADLAPVVQSAMEDVGADAKALLIEHIQADVYDKFDPHEYIRRYGGGILDENAMKIPYALAQSQGSMLRGLMTLRYSPDGSSSQWENPAGGDELIGRIESGSGYEWSRRPGPRPFWQKFVNELTDGQAFAHAFDNAMAMRLGADYEGSSVVVREAGDGEYDS
ncbi:MAG: hypothetical protein J6S14_19675 [Clostridia bacterium]|nr:hypothetical protein [Clostridia bacterium]